MGQLSTALREDIRALYHGGDGNERYVCPACAHMRKSVHRRDRTLSLRAEGELILVNCWHCGISGGVPMREMSEEASGFTPNRVALVSSQNPVVTDELPRHLATVEPSEFTAEPVDGDSPGRLAAFEWLRSRGISDATREACGVTTRPWKWNGKQREALAFPYKTKGQLYAEKLRTGADKLFSQRGSACTFWLEDQVAPGEDLVLVEGEVDALSIYEAGHRSVISTPNGAPMQVSDKPVTPETDRKFQYVYAGRHLFDQAKRVILAGDADAPGQALQEELARRIGKGRCWRVRWPEGCKDANDVLLKHGKQAILDAIQNAEPWPVQGVYDVAHYADRVDQLYQSGLAKGASTGMENVDELYSVVPGHLTIVTGAPSSGKTAWLNQVMVNLAKSEGWTFALFSTEMEPHLHIAELSSLYSGKPFFDGPTPRMTPAELAEAKAWVHDHFVFIELDGVARLDEIVDKLTIAVMRYGIRGFVVDPASYLKRPTSGESDGGEWAGQMLETFKAFAKSHECVAWLVAHPYKLRPREDGTSSVPKGYEISGSAHYFNRADFGLTIHRPQDARHMTEVHVWKVRFRWTGKEGMADLYYDLPTGRYDPEPFAPSTVYSMMGPAAFDLDIDLGADPWEI